MRPFTDTIPIDEALARIALVGMPIERTEPVALADAGGRVLAGDVTATRDVPPFDRSAMDGYAVRAADTAGASPATPVTLRQVDVIYTGQLPNRPIGPGECAEIATGAPLPDGADAVVMVEQTERGEAGVRMLAAARPQQHVGRRASDIAAGQVVLRRGDLLTPSRVGVLAALGLGAIEVFARPRVAILSTGNEIVEPGQPLAPGRIYDINKYTLGAIIAANGGVPAVYPAAGDTLEALESALDACLADDFLIFSGGSSVGERDLIIDLVRRRGQVVFHGVAVKPGKPTLLASIQGTPFLGMPGNPTSCLSNAYLMAVPILRRLARLPPARPETRTVPLAQRIVSPARRHQFYTVRIVDGAAVPAFKGSGDITSMSQADGYIEIPADRDIVEAGEVVEVKLF